MRAEWAICVTNYRLVTFFDSVARYSPVLLCVSWFTLLIGLSACQRADTPQAQIQAQLDTAVTAVRQRDLRTLRDFLSDDFVGNQSLHKAEMLAVAYHYFQQNPNITVTLMDTSITADMTTAQSHFKVLLTGGTDHLPERLRWLDVELQWSNVQSPWRIRSATWQDVGQSGVN